MVDEKSRISRYMSTRKFALWLVLSILVVALGFVAARGMLSTYEVYLVNKTGRDFDRVEAFLNERQVHAGHFLNSEVVWLTHRSLGRAESLKVRVSLKRGNTLEIVRECTIPNAKHSCAYEVVLSPSSDLRCPIVVSECVRL